MNYEVLNKLKNYFTIEELVDKETFDRFGDKAWQFFDPRLLESLLIIREGLGKSITVNNWLWGGRFTQRGLRTNLSSLVRIKTDQNRLYLSAHRQGMALDFDVDGINPTEVRQWIVEHSDLFRSKIRLERNFRGKPINWVHLDVFDHQFNPKIYQFDV